MGKQPEAECGQVFPNHFAHAEFKGVSDEGVADGNFGDLKDAK
jgi:hypothetical protein